MSKGPLVSVCIPSYNHAKFLPYCIESVLAQTYPNIEIIIVDDGSPDDSLKIAEDYAARHTGRIRVYTHAGNANKGISRTMNFGFDRSEGKYWSVLGSDDALAKQKIEKQVGLLESKPELNFVYSYASYIGADGEPKDGLMGEDISTMDDPLERLFEVNVIPGTAVLARRETIAAAGLYHKADLVYGDWLFWAHLATLGPFGFTPEPLVEYRLHAYNTSRGIHPLENLLHWKAAAEELDSVARQFLEPKRGKYRGIIKNYLKRMEAAAYVDAYFLAMRSKERPAAFEALKNAFRASPAYVGSPRRLGAIIKRGAAGFFSR